MTRIKICGITEEIHALAAAEAGADFIGLVFAPSPRQITPEQAKKIVTAVKESGFGTEVVGVFVNTPAAEVNRLAEFCNLDWVQLTGDEPWEYGVDIVRPLIKAIRIDEEHTGDIRDRLAAGSRLLSRRHLFLLDSPVKGKYGGTGVAFDWRLARPIAGQFPVIIAGGLNPDNVAEVVRTVSPWGVDVSSGVETTGVKDMKKIEAFVQAVRRADRA